MTVQNPLSREVFWHEYAKIPRHACQNSIAKGDFVEFWHRICEGTEQIRRKVTVQNPLSREVFWHRICEGTEQIRRKYKWFRKVVDERAEPL